MGVNIQLEKKEYIEDIENIGNIKNQFAIRLWTSFAYLYFYN